MKISLVGVPVQDPKAAHEIYTEKLGFISKEFDPDAWLAIVVSPEQTDGTALLLEPCKGTFAEAYQKAAFEARLPIMIFGVPNPAQELKRLESAGITTRPDLDRPKYGIQNLFEDGCGNFLMLEKSTA